MLTPTLCLLGLLSIAALALACLRPEGPCAGCGRTPDELPRDEDWAAPGVCADCRRWMLLTEGEGGPCAD